MTPLRAWVARLRNAHPDHHAIARGMAWVTLFVFVGKLAGAAKEMAVAWRYGVGQEVDAYLFVLNLVGWPVGVWFSVLTVVLVPLAARIRQDASEELPRFRSELFGLASLLGLAIGLVFWIGLSLLLRSSWTGLPGATVALASRAAAPLVLLIPLGLLVSLFSAWMLVAGRHANTLLEGAPALVLLLALLVFRGGGVEPLVWGTVVGTVLQMLCLALLLARGGDIERPAFTWRSPQWPAFRQGFGIMLAGSALMSLMLIIDQFFAARMGTGAIATLSYANRILALILSLGATAVTRGTLPVFSRAQAGGGAQPDLLAGHWVRLLFGAGIVALVAGWWLSPWMVQVVFERGAFTAADSVAVSDILRFGLIQLPFYFASLVLVALVVSQRRYHVIFAVGALNLAVKVVANALIVPALGLRGLMLSTSVMLGLSCLFMGVAVRRVRGPAAG